MNGKPAADGEEPNSQDSSLHKVEVSSDGVFCDYLVWCI